MPSQATDYRLLLHNWGQPKRIRPQYYDIPSGPRHRRKWETVVYFLESEQVGTGRGTSRAASRENAALSALKYLQIPLTMHQSEPSGRARRSEGNISALEDDTQPSNPEPEDQSSEAGASHGSGTDSDDTGEGSAADYPVFRPATEDHEDVAIRYQFQAGGATISAGGAANIGSGNVTGDRSGNTINIQKTVHVKDESALTSRAVIGALAVSNVGLAYTVYKLSAGTDESSQRPSSTPVPCSCNCACSCPNIAPQLPIGAPDNPPSSSISAAAEKAYSRRIEGGLSGVLRLTDNDVLHTMSIALPLSEMIFPKEYRKTRRSIKQIGAVCAVLALIPLVIGVG